MWTAGVNDRLVVLRAIAYCGDPKIAPADRLKALDALRELEVVAGSDEDTQSTDEIWREIDSWHAMTLATMRMRGGPERRIDPAQFPQTAAAVRVLVEDEVERAIREGRDV